MKKTFSYEYVRKYCTVSAYRVPAGEGGEYLDLIREI
jgi:hypothetical protein